MKILTNPFHRIYEAEQREECHVESWTSGIAASYPVCAVPSAVDMRASLPSKVEKWINITAVEQVPFGTGIMIIYTWRMEDRKQTENDMIIPSPLCPPGQTPELSTFLFVQLVCEDTVSLSVNCLIVNRYHKKTLCFC